MFTIINRYVNDKIFKPPVYDVSRHIGVLLEEELDIPYITIVKDGFSDDILELPIVLKILYCHGNAEDISTCKSHVNIFINELVKYFVGKQIRIVCFIWDYPTYGKSKEKEITLPLWEQHADAIWDNLLKYEPGTPLTYNIAWGYSIGSAMACYLSSRPSCDMVWLHAPFSTIVGGSGHTIYETLIGPWIDNRLHLSKQHDGVEVYALFGELDAALTYEMNSTALRPYVKECILMDGMDHLSFIELPDMIRCVELLGRHVQELHDKRHMIEIQMIEERIIEDLLLDDPI